MAYSKTVWKDRVDSKPSTYLVDGVPKIITKDNSGVSENGTTVNATKLNNMEQGIEDAHSLIDQTKAELEEAPVMLEATASIISIPNSATDGQISDLKIKARTYTNVLGDDGDFTYGNTFTGGASRILTVNGNTLNVKNNGASTQYSYAERGLYSNFPEKPNTYYLIHGEVQIINSDETEYISIHANDSNNFYDSNISVKKKIADLNKINMWQKIGSTYKTLDNITISKYVALAKLKNASTNTEFNVRKIMVVEITQDEYANSTVDELIEKYPFINNTKSTLPVRIKSVGKNLFDERKITPNKSIDGAGALVNLDGYNVTDFIRVEVGKTYKYSGSTSTKAINVYDANKTLIARKTFNTTYTIQAGECYVRFSYIKTDVNIMFYDNSLSTTYEEYKSNEVYLPSIGNSLSNGTKDEISADSSGQWWKVQRLGYKILQDSDFLTTMAIGTNVDSLTVKSAADGKALSYPVTELQVFGYETTTVSPFDLAENIGKWSRADTIGNSIKFAFAKGTTLEQAKASLLGKTLIYQLAEEIKTKLPPQIIQAYKSGMMIIEPFYEYVGKVIGGKIFIDINIPAKCIESIYLIDKETGALTQKNIIPTISANGLELTNPSFTEDQFYYVSIEYDKSLTTLPTIFATLNSTVKDNLNSLNKSIGNLDQKTDMQQNQIQILNEEIEKVSEQVTEAEATSKSYTDSKLQELVNAAPGALDTLKELAAALGNDANFSTTVLNSLANKVDKVSRKGLSANDYTTTEKNKLAGLDVGNKLTISASEKIKLQGLRTKLTGEITYTDSVPENIDYNKYISLGSNNYTNGKIIIRKIGNTYDDIPNVPIVSILFFDTNNLNTKGIKFYETNAIKFASNPVSRRRTLQLIDPDSTYGGIFLKDVYIEGSNLKLTFYNDYYSAQNMRYAIDWEVEM